jgi:hypothetical protein
MTANTVTAQAIRIVSSVVGDIAQSRPRPASTTPECDDLTRENAAAKPPPGVAAPKSAC